MRQAHLQLLSVAGAYAGSLQLTFTAREVWKGALLFGAGDVVAQGIERRVEASSGRKFDTEALMATRAFDTDRLVHATAIGTIYGGLMLPFVYQVAEGLLPGRSPSKVILKTMMSCGMLSTGGNYFSLVARRWLGEAPTIGDLASGAHWAKCVGSVNRDIFGVVKDDLKVWPLYDMFCFSVIPPSLRPTATAVVSVCWHSYVSFVANAAKAAEPVVRRMSTQHVAARPQRMLRQRTEL